MKRNLTPFRTHTSLKSSLKGIFENADSNDETDVVAGGTHPQISASGKVQGYHSAVDAEKSQSEASDERSPQNTHTHTRTPPTPKTPLMSPPPRSQPSYHQVNRVSGSTLSFRSTWMRSEQLLGLFRRQENRKFAEKMVKP